MLIERSKVADAKMRMFNRDGSEGRSSGNALRCVGKYLYDNKIVRKELLTVETLSGIRSIKLIKQGGEVNAARVDMGKAELRASAIPVKSERDTVIDMPAVIGGEEYRITCVSMGNPHCVVFCDNVEALDLEQVGPAFEYDDRFPERVNAEFVKVVNDHTLRMRVWERGSGETWACGTGACAAAVAAVENGYCPKDEDITVKLRGGDLIIRYTDKAVYMTGSAQTVYEGTITL